VLLTRDSHLEPEISDSVRRAVYNKAVQEVTATLLHEIAPLLGVALAEVAKDLPNSRAHEKLERLKSVLEAISDLRMAAAPVHAREFDIASMLRELVADEAHSRSVLVDLEGQSPFLINGDPILLGLAISNGLRNALDASADFGSDRHVVVNWGETDVEYWVSVLDGGRGLLGTAEQAFAIGNTTKKDHLGFGLAIARQALDTVAGVVRLVNGAFGGALFEVRWCK
jgi:C4-dicarboxylate-specific signal transduction histidine kinase